MSCALQDEVEPDPDRWDKEPEQMWQGSRQGAQGKRKLRAGEQPGAAAAADQEKLVLHAVSNIPHKGHLALFVPSTTIVRLAQRYDLLAPADLDVVKRKRYSASPGVIVTVAPAAPVAEHQQGDLQEVGA